jgi:hypothetical protein
MAPKGERAWDEDRRSGIPKPVTDFVNSRMLRLEKPSISFQAQLRATGTHGRSKTKPYPIGVKKD